MTLRRFWSTMITGAAAFSASVAVAATVTTQPPAVVYPPAVAPLYPPGIGFNPVVDYTKPNFSQSPNIRKFVDSLPGLGSANKNNLGQYIPVAVPDQTSFPGSDYYEIGLKQFNQQMSSDLPASGTPLRGYYQKNGPDTATQYLGPAVIAKRDRPVRLKFFNELFTGSQGDLPLPVDTGVMGAGMGPNGGNYTQNRANVHLHGGLTPWISDGTPHQWITPANEQTPYLKGDAFQNVPDMVNGSMVNGVSVPCSASATGPATCFTPAQNDGIGTYFYPNGQSSRLMFYHDHSYGITRLNVYAGEAAPYLLVDPVEEDLISGTNTSGKNVWGLSQILPDQAGLDNNTGLYRYGIPLVIQDKAFVNDQTVLSPAAQAAFPAPETGYTHTAPTLVTDPLWQYWAANAPAGSLWFPHEYMPVENMFDPTGNTTNGRYDYAPFMNPPMVPTNLTLPSPTIVPETFVDTAVVNGTAYPYLELPPDTVRFRILNASNDRSLNLQIYKADPLRINVTNGGSGYSNPVVTISGNAGTVGSATAVVSPGTISSIDVVGATHYLYAPTVTLTGGGGSCSSVTATIPSNTSGTLEIDAQGCTGFTSAPKVTISGGGGGTYTSATANVIPQGVITAITVTGATGFRSDLPAPTVTISDATGTGAAAVAFVNTEMKMVEAAPNPAYPTWPRDGRDGGVPDPTTAGPPWIQIGNEAGMLAQAVVWPQQPVDFEYTRQNLPGLGVTSHTLLLMPAMRADVVLDLRGYQDGDTLILYNDAPAPMPGFWAIDDYYTDDPDQTGSGGAPTTPPGFGPNTRTIMQIRIKGTKSSPFNFSLNALQAALPKAFAASQDKPLVPQMVYNDAYPGFASFDTYAQNYFDTLNLTGTPQPITKIKTTAPGNNYLTPPTVTIVGGGGTGATATAGLNPCGGVTLLTAGSGYTSPPTVTIGAPGAGGVRATAVASVTGGQVTAISIDEPGSNYSTTVAPTCTITGGGGTGATCSTFVATANTVGSITITKPGTGYTSQPYVFLTGGGGMGAMATALLNGAKIFTGKNLTEGFDPDYGRMDVRLGSTPNPLTPSIGNGQVIGVARYIDPPTEFMNDGETILWRLAHLGVDSHSMHFHLFNMQVVNRIDASNVVKPPYPDEIGWRETIRTNPMEDIIVAIQPKSMTLPFPIPSSKRLLDVTTPVNSTTNFLPLAPPVGIAAVPQITNTITDFGWEYVWHCHLLGHEENDMMRPLVLLPGDPVATAAPTTVTFPVQPINSASATQTVTLSNTATVGQPLFFGGIGISGANAGEFAQTNNCGTSLLPGAKCTFTVTFTPTAAGVRTAALTLNSTDPAKPATSVALTGTGLVPPAAPLNLTAAVASGNSVTLAWTDNSSTESSFAIWRSANGGAFSQVGTVTRNGAGGAGTGATVNFTNSGLTANTSYAYYVTAVNAAGASAPTATVTVLRPAAPLNLTVTPASASSNTLGWTDNSNNETSFVIWRSVNAGAGPFTQLTTINRTGTAITGTGTAVTFTDTGLNSAINYAYYVTAVNVAGASTPTATVSASVPVAPLNLTATVASASSVTLGWTDNSSNETSFAVWRSANAGAFTQIGTVTSLAVAGTGGAVTFTDTALTAGTSYAYKVTAVNPLGPSAPTATVTILPPASPSNLTVALAATSVVVGWTDNSSNETSFAVWRSANGGAFTQVGTVSSAAMTGTGGTLSFTDTALTAGTSYAYYVTAVNLAGASTPTATVAVPLPAAPLTPAATVASASSITVSWTDNSTNESSFAVWRSANGAAFTQVGTVASATGSGTGALLTFSNTGLTGGTSYSYYVTAVNFLAASAPTATVTALVPRLMAPSNLTATIASATSAALGWTDNSVNETSFVVWRSVNGAAFTAVGTVTRTAANTLATGGAVSFTNTGLVAGNSYAYYVTAVSAAGASSPSATVTLLPPAAPLNVTAIPVSATSITVSWTDNSNNETSFAVWRSANGGAFTQVGTVTSTTMAATGGTVSFSNTGLTGGTSYSYYVTAVNLAGASPATAPVTLVLPPVVAPSGLKATVASTTSITLNWTDNSTNETSFAVWRSVNGGAFAQVATVTRIAADTLATGGAVSFTNTGLSAGSSYAYYVTAVKATGASAPSATVTVTMSVAAPGNLALTSIVNQPVVTAQVTMNWTDNSNNETGFQLQRATNTAFTTGLVTTNLAANATSFAQSAVPRKATYYYRIKALNGALSSAWSNTLTVTVP